MQPGHPEICLFQPEIPQNTGNIGRLAAGTASRLHLIQPFGFDASDKNLRRAGLDYWPFLDLEIHNSLTDLLRRFEPHEVAFLSTRGKAQYTEMTSDVRLLIFGRETKGLTPEIYETWQDNLYTIPIFHDKVRSLNLANSVAIVVYDRLMRAGQSV